LVARRFPSWHGASHAAQNFLDDFVRVGVLQTTSLGHSKNEGLIDLYELVPRLGVFVVSEPNQ
jgi:hypothetical protein